MLKARELVAVLLKMGFNLARQRGSHALFKHPDGRVVTIPVHPAADIGRGLLRKILRDADLSEDELLRLLKE